MKTMKNFVAQQLSKKQMNEVQGGVSRKEYCATLDMIMESAFQRQDWSDQQWIDATRAYNTHCV